MRRTVSETKVGDNQVRYRIRIEDDPSSRDSFEARRKLLDLFGTFLQSPDLLNCGYNTPQRISMYHSGEGWILEAEATVEIGA